MAFKFLERQITVFEAAIYFVCSYAAIELIRRIYSYNPKKLSHKTTNSSSASCHIQASVSESTPKHPSTAETANIPEESTVNNKVEEEDEEEDDDDDDCDYDLNKIRNDYSIADAPFKMVLCVNTSLGMGKGKIGAQCGHATLGAYKIAAKHCPSAVEMWTNFGQAKIAVKIDDDVAMEDVAMIARTFGLVTYIVEDAGRTQIAAGSKTVLAIGPAPDHVLKTITGNLKLL